MQREERLELEKLSTAQEASEVASALDREQVPLRHIFSIVVLIVRLQKRQHDETQAYEAGNTGQLKGFSTSRLVATVIWLTNVFETSTEVCSEWQ